MEDVELSTYMPSLDAEVRRAVRTPYCVNVVLIGVLSRPLDLARLACLHEWLSYKPPFAAAVGHVENPRLTMLIFPSGRVMLVGAPSVYAAMYALDRVATRFATDFPGTALLYTQVQNLTCTVKLGHKMALTRCTRENLGVCEMVPDTFPGMHVRPAGEESGTSRHIVFRSGELVVTGARTELQVWQSLNSRADLYARYATDSVTEPEVLGAAAEAPANEAAEHMVEAEIQKLIRQFKDV